MVGLGGLRRELHPGDRHGFTLLHLCEQTLKKLRKDITPSIDSHHQIGLSITLPFGSGDITISCIFAGNHDDGSARIADDLSQAAAGTAYAAARLDVAVNE